MMMSFALLFAIVAITPSYRVAPFPWETEQQAIECATWEKDPESSPWVMKLGDRWGQANSRTVRFRRPWGWRLRRTSIRINGVSADFSLMVNGLAEGKSHGFHDVVEFDLTPHLKLIGENVIEFKIGAPKCSNEAFRSVRLVSTHPTAPQSLRVETELAKGDTSAVFKVVDDHGKVVKSRRIDEVRLWSDEMPYVYITPIEHVWGWGIFKKAEYRVVGFGYQDLDLPQLRAVGASSEMYGKGSVPATLDTMLSAAETIKSLNANAVFAEDYSSRSEWLNVCDHDGIYVITDERFDNCDNHPCVLRLPRGKWPKRVEIPATAEGKVKLRNRFSQVHSVAFDWENTILTISNNWRHIAMDGVYSYQWRAYGEDGALSGRGNRMKLNLASRGGTQILLSGVNGDRLEVDILRDGDVCVTDEFKRGK